jgi:uncharacterized protein
VKAAPEVQLRLLELAELDSVLDRLAHRRRTLPEHAEVEQLQERLAAAGDGIVAAETEISDLDREQRKAEGDVDQVRARATRDQQRLDSGQISSPKELESLQSEIGSLQRRQSDLEEVVLEVMERREAAVTGHADRTAERDRLTGELAAVTERRDKSFGEIDDESATASQQRTSIVKELPDDLLALYERLREQHKGVGAAALRRGRCEGCHLALNTVDLNRIRNAPADELVRCEECRRILVRTPESGL